MDAFDQMDRQLHRASRLIAWEQGAQAAAGFLVVTTTIALVGAIWASRVPDFSTGRRFLLLTLGVCALATLGWWSWNRLRARDRTVLARRVQKRVPSLGRGIEAVVRMRSQTDEPDAAFSTGLLVDQANRVVRTLEEMPSRALIRYHGVGKLVIAALLPPALGLAWMAADPWPAIRGLRGLAGLTDAATPDWLMGPPRPVDALAFDVRVVVLRRSPDGQVSRVPSDESGDVMAPPGMEVEVSGRLRRPAGLGHLVVSGAGESRYPLVLGPGDHFRATFPIIAPGTWHLQVVVPPGLLMTETVRRRVVPISLDRPVVEVVPPERLALKPGESAVVRFSAESASGLAGIDVIYEFPLDGDRTPVRIRASDVPPGTRATQGEVVFTLPEDVLDVGGRVDLIVEAQDGLGRGPEDAGRGEPVRFMLDSPAVRRAAALEGRERLLNDLVELLAAVSTTDAAAATLPPPLPAQLRAVSRSAAAAAVEAEAERDGPGSTLGAVARDLETLAAVADPGREAVLLALERSILWVDDVVAASRAAILSARLAGLARDAARLRQASGGDANALREALRAVVRARRALGLLDATRRQWQKVAELEGGMLRFVPATLARVSMQAREQLLAVEDAVRRDDASTPQRRKVLEAGHAALVEVLEAFRTVELPGVSPPPREAPLPPEVLPALRQALSAQRDVMDRTAQAAFLLRRRTENLSDQRAPDAGRLATLVEEARALTGRVSLEGMDPTDAQTLATLRDDLGAATDLLVQGDLVTARRLTAGAMERINGLIQDWRDVAEWTEEEQPESAAFLRAQAARLGRSVPPLREAARTLSDWSRERTGVVTRDDREGAARMLRDQERALALMARASEGLRRTLGSDADDRVATAQSARRNMEEAARRLAETNPMAAEAHQRQAIQDLQRLRKALERGAADPRIQAAVPLPEDDPVELSLPERLPPGDAFSREVRAHAETPVPAPFDLMVRAYYDAILGL